MYIFIENTWVKFNKELFETRKQGKRKLYYYNNIKLPRRVKIKAYSIQSGKQIERKLYNSQLTSFIPLTKTEKEKLTKKQLYNNENYNNYRKAEKTNLNKYGVKHNWQRKDVKEKIKQTNLDKYGVEYIGQSKEVKEKIKQTNLENYGTFSHLSSIDIREKITQTNLENYGVSTNLQRKDVREKITQTNLEKYGSEYPIQNKNILIKQKQTNLKRYGVKNVSQLEDVKEKVKIKNRNYIIKNVISRIPDKIEPLFDIYSIDSIGYYDNIFSWKCKKCGTEFEDFLYSGNIPRCPKCFPKLKNISQYESEIIYFLKELEIKNIIQNDRSLLNGKELDVYLPDYKLAIEFNGLYWHSELNGKDKNYHLNKTNLCNEKGTHLIHIFEDEWTEKQDIVESIISGKLGLHDKVYARKCNIKEINNVEKFLDTNHLQGSINSKINVGLFYKEELVSLLCLSKPRYNKNYDWEITRFVNKLNTSVIGGFAKLIKYFKSKYNGNIITYSDRRYFDGSIYLNNGFKQLETSKPNYFYTDYIQRFNRIGFQKHKLEEQLDVYDPELTEWENMQLNGWDRIWDCGNNVYIKNAPD